MIPKRIARSAPEYLAASMAPMMAFIEGIASPLVFILSMSTEGLIRLLGLHRTRQEDVTEEELQSLIVEGEKAGVIEEEERDMIAARDSSADSAMRLGISSPSTSDRKVVKAMTRPKAMAGA